MEVLEVLEVVSEDSRISNFPVKCLAPVPASSSLDSRLCTPHSSRQFQLIVTINLSPLISSPLTFYEEWLDMEPAETNASFWTNWGNCSVLPWNPGKTRDVF